jgi:hypothetical protein
MLCLQENAIQVKVFASYLWLQAFIDAIPAVYYTVTGFKNIDDICKGKDATDDCRKDELQIVIGEVFGLWINVFLKVWKFVRHPLL